MIDLPEKLLFEVTACCNYHCPFCYCVWHEFPQLAAPELDTDAWKGIIDECAARGVKEIIFTGGEATLREDLWELMEYACNHLNGGDIALFTNGSLMTEERISWCKERRIRLSTSLQGLRTYARQTGTRRNYKRVLRFMARAAELGWPVSVSISVSSNTPNLSRFFIFQRAELGCRTLRCHIATVLSWKSRFLFHATKVVFSPA